MDEFRRGRGESYEEIAAAGGGIRNTAKAFVEGDLEEVVEHQQHVLTECSTLARPLSSQNWVWFERRCRAQAL